MEDCKQKHVVAIQYNIVVSPKEGEMGRSEVNGEPYHDNAKSHPAHPSMYGMQA